MLSPLSRAIAQLQDPVFLGVVWRSLALSGAVFLGLLAGSRWAVEQVVAQTGSLGWHPGLAGAVGPPWRGGCSCRAPC